MIDIQRHKALDFKSLVGPFLLLGLLFLRLPFLVGIRMIISPTPSWLVPTFEIGTYLLTALLILVERKRLADFHMGAEALVLLIFGQITKPLLYSIPHIPFIHSSTDWILITIAVLLLLSLIILRARIPKVSRKVMIWIGIAVIVGIVGGLIVGLSLGYLNGFGFGPRASFPALIVLFQRQLTFSATLEEPLFRGFLWGYLKKFGWNDGRICLFQAFLFCLGHTYYINTFPFSFWAIVPATGLVLGLMVWRSRSIATSMVVHGLINSIGDFVAHFRF